MATKTKVNLEDALIALPESEIPPSCEKIFAARNDVIVRQARIDADQTTDLAELVRMQTRRAELVATGEEPAELQQQARTIADLEQRIKDRDVLRAHLPRHRVKLDHECAACLEKAGMTALRALKVLWADVCKQAFTVPIADWESSFLVSAQLIAALARRWLFLMPSPPATEALHRRIDGIPAYLCFPVGWEDPAAATLGDLVGTLTRSAYFQERFEASNNGGRSPWRRR